MAGTRINAAGTTPTQATSGGTQGAPDSKTTIKRAAGLANSQAREARIAELFNNDNRALDRWIAARRNAHTAIKAIKSLPANEQVAYRKQLKAMQALSNEAAANITRLKQQGATERPPKPNPFDQRPLPGGFDKPGGPAAPAPRIPSRGPF